jgi:DNA-binding CsgD family transcriptional regulator
VDMKRDLHGPATGLVARIVPVTGEDAGASRGALALAVRPKPLLSNREMHVLKEVAEGLSNKQIAQRLGIKEKTVRNHLVSVYDKLRATNRTHAVMLAIRLGLQIP